MRSRSLSLSGSPRAPTPELEFERGRSFDAKRASVLTGVTAVESRRTSFQTPVDAKRASYQTAVDVKRSSYQTAVDVKRSSFQTKRASVQTACTLVNPSTSGKEKGRVRDSEEKFFDAEDHFDEKRARASLDAGAGDDDVEDEKRALARLEKAREEEQEEERVRTVVVISMPFEVQAKKRWSMRTAVLGEEPTLPHMELGVIELGARGLGPVLRAYEAELEEERRRAEAEARRRAEEERARLAPLTPVRSRLASLLGSRVTLPALTEVSSVAAA